MQKFGWLRAGLWVVQHCARGCASSLLARAVCCFYIIQNPLFNSLFSTQINCVKSVFQVWWMKVVLLEDAGEKTSRDLISYNPSLDHGAVKQSLHPSPDRQSTDQSCNQRQGRTHNYIILFSSVLSCLLLLSILIQTSFK